MTMTTSAKQQIPVGYKQTEAGMIPEDWNIKRLGDIGKFKGGSGFPTKYQGEVYGDYPFYKVSDMNNDGNQTFMKDANNWINEKIRKVMGVNIFPKHSIVFAKIGAAIFLERKKILSYESCIDNNMMGLIFDENQTNYRFLHYLFLSFQLGKLVSTTALPSLNGKEIAELNFAFPEMKEQSTIASALSNIDALIEKLEEFIEKKNNIKQGAMQKLLTGKLRLPDFKVNHAYKQTEVGLIPEDWKVIQLGNLGVFKNGINKGIDSFGHGFPFVNLMDVFGVSCIPSVKSFGLVDTSNAERQIYNLRKGDVLFIRSSVKPSGVGLTAVIEDSLLDTVYSGFLIRFRDNGNLNNGFKKYCFYEDGFRRRVINASSVSANTNINQDSLKNLLIILPSTKTEQEGIASILSAMDTEIEKLESQLDKYKNIKQGMMQTLLTGKIRLINK